MNSDLQTARQDSEHGVVFNKTPRLSPDHDEHRWYAAYTIANHEKCVAHQFAVRQIEHFIPLYESARRWKDRRMILHLPLFPGYVFVRITLRDQLRVVQIPGVVRLVGFNGKPAALPEEEISALRASLGNSINAVPHPLLATGRRVRVTNGPLNGLTGVVLRRRGKSRIVISIELLQQAICVDMVYADLAPESLKTPGGREIVLASRIKNFA